MFEFSVNIRISEPVRSFGALLEPAVILWCRRDRGVAMVAPPPSRSSASKKERGWKRRGRQGLRVAFRGGYHCRCWEIGRKMGNPAAWWQMVDHRGRENHSLRPPVLRGRRQGLGRIHRGHWTGTRSYMDAKLGTVMYVSVEPVWSR